jgi:hypothetical protein
VRTEATKSFPSALAHSRICALCRTASFLFKNDAPMNAMTRGLPSQARDKLKAQRREEAQRREVAKVPRTKVAKVPRTK